MEYCVVDLHMAAVQVDSISPFYASYRYIFGQTPYIAGTLADAYRTGDESGDTCKIA